MAGKPTLHQVLLTQMPKDAEQDLAAIHHYIAAGRRDMQSVLARRLLGA